MPKHNPKYDDRYVFTPVLEALRQGDVLLTRNVESNSFSQRAQSRLIAITTGGRFSHALMCTVPPTLIEAVATGVSNITAMRCFVHDLKNVRVLRYPDEHVARKAASAAFRFFAKPYDFPAALRLVLPDVAVSKRARDRLFCSALVVAAFRAAGAPEFASTNPMRISPSKLARSAAFTDVTADVFTRVLSPNNVEEMSALDGDRQPSPLDGQATLLNSYYEQLSIPIMELIDRHPPLAEHRPTSFFECIEFIRGLMWAVRRFPAGVEEDRVREQARAIDQHAFDLLAERKWQAMNDAARVSDEKNLQYELEESFKQDPDLDPDVLLGKLKVTRHQIISRASVLNDPNSPPGQSLTWDAWVELTEDTLRDLYKRRDVFEEVLARAFPDVKKPD
jgi:uncharacterized protein YycO